MSGTADEAPANPPTHCRLGEYLCQRLVDAGVEDLFAVAGDFVLGLLDKVVESKLNLVCCCNELNAAYAADGYARVKGLGAVATTYAVGELSAINGVAGAFAESVPVVKITGVPARKYFEEVPLLHHTLGDYMVPFKMYKCITVGQAFLDNPETAAKEIDRVLKACKLYKKPVYIAVPSDMVTEEIPITEGPWKDPLEFRSDPDALQDCVEELLQKIHDSKRPLFIPGVDLIRRNRQELFRQLTDKSNIPYVTMLLSKGLLEEVHPHFIGLYSGDRSRSVVKEAVDQSDCLIIIGEKLTDFNTGGFTAVFDRRSRVIIDLNSVRIGSHTYNNVSMCDVLERVIQGIKPFTDPPYRYVKASQGCVHRVDSRSALNVDASDKLTMTSLFGSMAKYFPPHSVILAETGASLFSAAETMLPTYTTFIGQTFYGSIGYSVGSCLGVCVARKAEKQGRVVLFVGDGSFQLTCQEISTIIRYNLCPLIILINNDGYTIERVITDNVYNDINMWKYHKLPEIFNGDMGYRCETLTEFSAALAQADKKILDSHRMQFIEVILDKWDCNQLLKDAGRTMAINNSLTPVEYPKDKAS